MKPKLSYLEEVTQEKDYKESNSLSKLLGSSYGHLKKAFNNKRHLFASTITQSNIDLVWYELEGVVIAYNNGDIVKSIALLMTILVNGGKWILKESTLKKNSITYRFRTPTYNGDAIYQIFGRNDLFHMPFDALKNQGNMRYSINGFPCLYLGQSIYDCWEETRRPDLSRVNYAAFKNTRDLKLLTVECPDRIENIEDIKRYFVFALCSKKVDLNEDESKFKFQYVIPELLLGVLINQMRTSLDYEGIRFTSSRFYDERLNMYTVKPIFYNYVFPIQQSADKGHCQKLKDTFKVSEVRADYMIKMKQSSLPYPSIFANLYDYSYFRRLELDIEQGKLGEFKKIVDI